MNSQPATQEDRAEFEREYCAEHGYKAFKADDLMFKKDRR